MKNNSTRPAFPHLESWRDENPEILVCNEQGLTKREYFAAKAMQGILASLNTESDSGRYCVNDGYLSGELIAKDAIICADELLKQLSNES